MKSKSIAVVFSMIMILVLAVGSIGATQSDTPAPSSQSSGQIYLYGEMHGVDKILDKEFKLWYDYYHNQNMRHLFLELPYYTAEFLNIWMQSDSDDILNNLYFDWANTAGCNPEHKEFFKKIKIHCPETIFHGTDVGHQYNTTGVRFLKYLRSNNLEDSEQYLIAKEVIEQGKKYHFDKDHVYRENMMVKNFIREFDKLKGESIMGIYGAAHTGLEAMNHTNSVPCMANQLKERYGDAIHSVDLRVDIIQVGGKEYKAMYFGKQELTRFEDYAYREFWRLENAYEDFEDRPKTGNILPYNNYPMLIETGQVFVIDYIKEDGSVIRKYFRSDGLVWENLPCTEEFIVE
ncbi:hypothetical protein [Halothermothrix orenii]|uniref:Haem-binding uptake Tiki superfamily ChaN domain-containing protein n=1 Tax=Halothermothrix orenii (strain H 168 / OCM 544 / DSM 9562) TaxID=373903 RepID=B8CYF1_HALOH|nr:hypothetical protein [Halothermothrix orenii]ACL70320.1 hypothetical protein Hore_15710 [Halothermothrix orenii H 168]